MPALNVTFTDQEMAELREAAEAAGMSLKAYVHAASLRDRQRRRFVDSAVKYFDEHADEFRAAFPEDAPQRPSAAA